MKKLLHLESLKELVSECLNVDIKQVKHIAAIGGMTNKNYKVMIDDQNYVLRVPGNGTEKMISRVDEIKNAAGRGFNVTASASEGTVVNEVTEETVQSTATKMDKLTLDAGKNIKLTHQKRQSVKHCSIGYANIYQCHNNG